MTTKTMIFKLLLFILGQLAAPSTSTTQTAAAAMRTTLTAYLNSAPEESATRKSLTA